MLCTTLYDVACGSSWLGISPEPASNEPTRSATVLALNIELRGRENLSRIAQRDIPHAAIMSAEILRGALMLCALFTAAACGQNAM